MNRALLHMPDFLMTGDSYALPLRGYHMPDPVSWWPLAPGWWAILALGLTCILFFFYMTEKKQQEAWRDKAMTLLDSIFQNTAQETSPHLLAKQTSILLRRICKSRFPENPGIHLVGEEWLHFLDNCAYGPEQKQSFFHNETGQQLLRATYDRSVSVLDRDALYTACLSWIKALPAKTWRE
ncbi:DUF4381 domain-containing protein [Desulfogranum japonicum]|uniref:DUF4381 domain-containing protein n=1 Tax=Desulfogranum japonicum TaxID=231447 RepID=UPI00048BDA75|nr:DUF4381 domain-containing protein [Desulfogranum japonicum]